MSELGKNIILIPCVLPRGAFLPPEMTDLYKINSGRPDTGLSGRIPDNAGHRTVRRPVSGIFSGTGHVRRPVSGIFSGTGHVRRPVSGHDLKAGHVRRPVSGRDVKTGQIYILV